MADQIIPSGVFSNHTVEDAYREALRQSRGVQQVVPVPPEWLTVDRLPNTARIDQLEPTFGGIAASHLLMGRLRMDVGQLVHAGFSVFQVRRAGTGVALFVVFKGQALMFQEDEGAFPSDELVTKIRVLL